MKEAASPASHVFICGAHSIGKTTLVKELETVPMFSKYQRVTEIARRVIEEKGWTRGDFALDTNRGNFKLLNLTVIQEYRKILGELENVHALFDRGPDALIYIRYYLSEEEYQEAIATEDARYCIERFRSGVLFILAPHEEFIVDDFIRLVSSVDELWEYTKLMCNTLDELRIPYHIIHDKDLKKRTQVMTEHMSGLGDKYVN